jgi:polyribonucleotide nucleotidyltransferase
VAALRIAANKDKEIRVNPDYNFREENNLFDAIFSGKNHKISMIETEAEEVKNEDFLEATKLVLEEIEKLENFFVEVIKKEGREKKNIISKKKTDFLDNIFQLEFKNNIQKDFLNLIKEDKFDFYKKEFIKRMSGVEISDFSDSELGDFFELKIKELVRENILQNNQRLDGRALDEIRPL